MPVKFCMSHECCKMALVQVLKRQKYEYLKVHVHVAENLNEQTQQKKELMER